jgi:hypothetical protein
VTVTAAATLAGSRSALRRTSAVLVGSTSVAAFAGSLESTRNGSTANEMSLLLVDDAVGERDAAGRAGTHARERREDDRRAERVGADRREVLAAARLPVAALDVDLDRLTVTGEEHGALDHARVVERAVAVGVEDADRAVGADAQALALAQVDAAALRDVVEGHPDGDLRPRAVGAGDLLEVVAAQELVDDHADSLPVASDRGVDRAIVRVGIDVRVVAEGEPRLEVHHLVPVVIGPGDAFSREHLEDLGRTVGREPFAAVRGLTTAENHHAESGEDPPVHPELLRCTRGASAPDRVTGLRVFVAAMDAFDPQAMSPFNRTRGPMRFSVGIRSAGGAESGS